jgi:glutamyl/glutaminyl-tRNA synthetase
MRATLGGGHVSWTDRIVGERQGDVAANGDLPVLDRHGNWTYGFSVVVDDLRQGVDLVVRGEDLLEATAAQIRLGRALGRTTPPAFAHHPLVGDRMAASSRNRPAIPACASSGQAVGRRRRSSNSPPG